VGVDFVTTDITSPRSCEAAFSKPWHPSISHLPLTVFHTAAVIIPSDRSKHLYAFPEAVNIRGTRNVLAAARKAGASVFSSTSSASIAIRPVQPFVAPWAAEPGRFAQVLNEDDFYKPLRAHEDFFGNYPASKATAERIVCEANRQDFRTGCIRPGNGVYGNPTDNTVGGPLSRTFMPTWVIASQLRVVDLLTYTPLDGFLTSFKASRMAPMLP
jgi:nucleoside-diphosphate-sugar epimerase